MSTGIATLGYGTKVHLKTRKVVDDRRPMSERYYYGSRITSAVKCMDGDKYMRTELFSPVIYDLEQQPPSFDPRWMKWSGSGRNKRLLRVNYPDYYKAYWYEQRRRCLEGYEVGGVRITGPFYDFLNFWGVRTKKRGVGVVQPKFLDLQKRFYDRVDLAREEGKNLAALKRRQIGFSEMCAHLCGYEYTFFPLSQSLIIAGEEKYATNAMNKVRVGLEARSEYSYNLAREFYQPRLVDKELYIKSGYLNEGVDVGYLSEIEAMTTHQNIMSVNGKTPSFAFLEEFGINRNGPAVFEYLLPAIQEQGVQDGRLILIVGTGGEMDYGAAGLQKIFYNPDKYNMLSVTEDYEGVGVHEKTCDFYPNWLFYVMDEDGNSYKEAGLELLEAERKKKDGEGLQIFITQFPSKPSEAFIERGESPFNAEKLNRVKQLLLKNGGEDIGQRGRFEWIYEEEEFIRLDGSTGAKIKGVKWVAAPKGKEGALDEEGDLLYPAIVFEHPDRPYEKEGEASNEHLLSDDYYRGLYGAGLDPVNKDDAPTSKSQVSCSIYKGYLDANHTSNHFPARITYRPKKKSKAYDMVARMCYYFGCKVLIEWSNDSAIDWFKKENHRVILKEKPMLMDAKRNTNKPSSSQLYGVDPNTKHYWVERYGEWIEKYYMNMTDIEQVSRALKFKQKKSYNCDITDGAMLALQHIEDNFKRKQKAASTEKKRSRRPLMGYFHRNGKIRRV